MWPAAARLGEGTVWSQRFESLYWVDILGRHLHRYRPADGQRGSWTFDEDISAAAERADSGDLLVTLKSGFAFFDPVNGSVTRLHDPEPERRTNRFNDGKCDAAGRFWGGTMDFACRESTGALYRFDADRRCTRHLDGFDITNGPTWSADGRTMYFTETGRREVNAFDFDPESGTLNNRRVWLKFATEDGKPDGMTTDADGRIWIAHWSAGCVTCRDPSGHVLARVELPTSQVTNCAFGGPDLSTLYVTSAADGMSADPLAGGLFAVETDARGLPANLFGG